MTYVTRLNQSFGYFEGGVRVGRFHLWGYVPGDEVAAFYREQMPNRALRLDLRERAAPRRDERDALPQGF